MTFRDKPTPVHRHIPGKLGRKVIQPITTPSPLVYLCAPCKREFKKYPTYGACPYCSEPVLAINKDVEQ